MSTSSSTINIGSKQVTVESNLTDGSYTVKDSSGRLIGNGNANTGGNINFNAGSTVAQQDLVNIRGTQALRGGLRDYLNARVRNQVESTNLRNINDNASNDQKGTISNAGYGNKVNLISNNVSAGSPVGSTLKRPAGISQDVWENLSEDDKNDAWQEAGMTEFLAGTPGWKKVEKDGGTVLQEVPQMGRAIGKWPSSETSATYPSKYLNDSTDFLQFKILEYKANPGFEGLAATGGLSRPSERRMSSKASFNLPIPQNAQVNNTVAWGEDRLNPVQAGVGGAVSEILGGTGVLGDLSEAAKKNTPGLVELVRTEAARKIVGGGNFLTRQTGAVINSNLELFFTGPGLRQFNFQYRLTPRDDREALEVRKIIRMSKRAMAARIEQKRLFLYTPHVFQLMFFFKGKAGHPFMNRFKPAALTGFTVNHTPDGAYMTYDDGSPVAYQLQFSFREIEPIYDIDYDDAQGLGF